MEWTKNLNASDKKQMMIIGAILVGIIAFLVFAFVSIADRQKITMDEAMQSSPEANRIDQMAMELARMAPAGSYNTAGQEVSQYEIQNPTDGGYGDDGTYDDSVTVLSDSIQESRRIQQSVDLSNGVPASVYMNQKSQPQPVQQPAQPAEAAVADGSSDSLSDLKPSVIPAS